jgi:hypothetical protein
MSASNYLELAILDHVFGGYAFTPPATVYVSLHTGNPGETGSANEVSGGAYERKSVTNDNTGFDAAAAVSGLGTKKNAAIIQFVDPVGANWGTITHFAIWDASTAGNCLVYGALNASVVVNDGDPGPRFNAQGLSITCE